jgi:Matrixin
MRGGFPLLAAAALASFVLVSGSGGYTVGGVPWPGSTIAYANETHYGWSVDQAARAWNGVGAGIRFVPVRDASLADMVIRYKPGRTHGHASLGFRPRGATVWLTADLTARSAAIVAAHELGHVLGLHHESHRCAIMNPGFDPRRPRGCPIASCSELSRCLVQPDDARGVADLYRKRRPAMLAPPVTDVVVAAGRPLMLHWRSPSWIGGRAVLIRSVPGHWCSPTPFRGPGVLDAARFAPGAVQVAPLRTVSKGEWCTGIWVQARGTQLPGEPVYLRFTVP